MKIWQICISVKREGGHDLKPEVLVSNREGVSLEISSLLLL